MRTILCFTCLLLAIVIVDASSSVMGTLTTAIREITSAKATAVYRRTKKESDGDEYLNPISDLGSDARRKGHSYVFKWDRWCQLQAKTGNCDSKINKYFYESQLDECSSFVYSGCGGNRNNFNTLSDCQLHCKGAYLMKVEDVTKPTFCHLQPDTGSCLALLTKYYFDINTKSCKSFKYGGCGGNQNKFATMHSCMKICAGTAT